MLSSKQGILFDCDGTLVDSLHDVYLCINKALNSIGCAYLPKAIIRTLVGPDLEGNMNATVKDPNYNWDDFISEYVRIYSEECTENTHLYDGVKDILERLAEKNKILGVYTNKPSPQTKIILREVGVLQYFDEVIGPDVHNVAKPDPTGALRFMADNNLNAIQTVLVGDTETDCLAAENAGIDTVLVTHGYGDHSRLESRFNLMGIVDNFSELLKK